MTRSIVAVPAGQPIVTVERVFDAPRSLMFRLFTDPYHLAQFFGPHGVTNVITDMDVRPGGGWHHVMYLPDGSEYAFISVYLEIVEPERIVFRNVADNCGFDGLPTPQITTTIRFEQVGAGTLLIAAFQAASVEQRDDIVRRGVARNMTEGNEKLAAYLTTLC